MVKLFLPIKSQENLIPSINELKNLKLETKFGRTPFYLLYDTSTEEAEFIKNTNHHFNGNTPPFALARDKKADVVIASHLGYKPYEGFKNLGIPVYHADSSLPIFEIITSFNQNKLTLLEQPEEGSCCSSH